MNIYNLTEAISPLLEPTDKEEFNQWVQQKEVIQFLEQESVDEHIIIYAVLPHAFLHAVFIPTTPMDEHTIEDLQNWSHNPYSGWGIASSSNDVWIEGPLSSVCSKVLSNGEQIIFARSFDGDEWRKRYFELEQRVSHVLDIHYLAERNAWCRLDRLGDIEEIVKIIEISNLPANGSGTIITVKKDALREYASVCQFSLCRMYDFTRYKTGSFTGWDEERESQKFGNERNIFGNVTFIEGYGSYSRGFQIIDVGVSKAQIISSMWHRTSEEEAKQYATFIAYDWKNKRIGEISCAPSALANYFTKSDLPYDTTPAFFRPEVLLKYKSDRQKYKLNNRSIGCRGAWHLKTFDINDAGQVHTYLIYLSHLPYEEQLHWKQYNEPPRASLSERAITTDFMGQFYEGYDPLLNLKHKLDQLYREKAAWWTLRDENAPQKVQYPYTSSRDEWAEEILNLDQLLIEGLEQKWLRRKSQELGRNPDDRFRALKLTEECLIGAGFDEDHAYQLMSPLHEVHNLRSKLKGHASGNEAEQIRLTALKNFGSFRKHFEHLCRECDDSLGIMMRAFANL